MKPESITACPDITVAIPTYKRPKYLRQAIDSAINQIDSGVSYEVIVVNNDPQTDISAMERQFADAPVKVTFYTNDHNLGMLGNVNRCMELAKGKYIAYLHDDDLLMPDYMERIAGAVSEYPGAACIIPKRFLLFQDENGGRSDKLESKRRLKGSLKNIFISRLFNRRRYTEINVRDNIMSAQNCYCAPSCGALFRRDKVRKNGLFFPEGTYSWDFISFRRLNENEKIFILNTPVSVYRMTAGASLKPLVQYQSYLEFDKFMASGAGDEKCAAFVKKYGREIKYINYKRLSADAADMLRENEIDFVTSPSGKLKYYTFMLKRFRYWSSHRLDVEVPMTKKALKTLEETHII